MRLYKIDKLVGYYGDQGRDLLEVQRNIRSGTLPLQGPSASVGNFHLGPIYYLLIIPSFILFNGSPLFVITPNLLGNILLILLSFFILLKLFGFETAFVFASLLTFSPHYIDLSRGSWNPNLQPALSFFIVSPFLYYLKLSKDRFLFLSFFIFGIGIQLHYTFISLLLPIFISLIIFKKQDFLKVKFWRIVSLGILIPLLPFLFGQVINNYQDLIGIWEYLQNNSTSQNRLINIRPFLDRLIYPFNLYFAPEYLSWFFTFFAFPIILVTVIINTLFSFKMPEKRLPITLFLIFLLSSAFVAMIMRFNYYWHYHASYSIYLLVLISILIGVTLKIKYLRILSFAFFCFLLLWEVFNISHIYSVKRSIALVEGVSNQIVADAKQRNDNSLGIFLLSPLTPSEGFEYQYLIEKARLKTYSSSGPLVADYLIVENTGQDKNGLNMSTNGRIVHFIGNINLNDESLVIKSIDIYRLDKI